MQIVAYVCTYIYIYIYVHIEREHPLAAVARRQEAAGHLFQDNVL